MQPPPDLPAPELVLAYDQDLDVLEPLVAACHAFEGVESDLPARLRALRPLLGESPIGRVWLLRAGGAIIGYAAICFGYSIEFAGRDAFVDEIFIDAAHRGRGYGRRALASVAAAAAGLGVRALHLEVARDNARARAVYTSCGFVPRDRYALMSRRLGAES